MTTATIKLPGGLDAVVEWKPGSLEGEIWADATWQQNSPVGSGSRAVAEGRADNAVEAPEPIEWNWQPMSERGKSPRRAA